MPHGKACSEKMWACFYLPQGTATLNYAILISESAKGEYTVRDNNTQGKTEFITEHIFWLALAWIWYRSLLFRCVPQHTLTESKLILLGFVLVFSAVGILFQMQNNRNGMGVILDLVLGYGAYTVLTYWPIYPRLIKICLVAAGILSLLYAALVLCRRMRSRKYVLKILRRRLGLVAFMSKKIVGMSLALIMGGFWRKRPVWLIPAEIGRTAGHKNQPERADHRQQYGYHLIAAGRRVGETFRTGTAGCFADGGKHRAAVPGPA